MRKYLYKITGHHTSFCHKILFERNDFLGSIGHDPPELRHKHIHMWAPRRTKAIFFRVMSARSIKVLPVHFLHPVSATGVIVLTSSFCVPVCLSAGPVGSIIYADLYGSIKIKFTVLIRDTDQ